MDEILTLQPVEGRSYRIVNPGGRIGSKLVNGEPYERQLLAHIRARRLAGSAIDVGAHVGNHALYLAAICGLRVYAFEPNPDTFRRLVDNIALNPELDIHPMQLAAGAVSGVGRLAGTMQLKLDRGTIPVVKIDDVLALADLAVVKIDVEGMEPLVLAGMTEHLERCRPVVYAETHTATADRNTAEVLAPLGYQLTATIAMGSVMQCWEHR